MRPSHSLATYGHYSGLYSDQGKSPQVLSSQIYSTLSHSLEPIVVTHHIRWTIVMTNLDSHMSELCCLLSLHVLDYTLLHDVCIATRTTCLLASTTCSHMTTPISPGCRWCTSGHRWCGCEWPGHECGWCKGHRCKGCQHRLRGAWGANGGVEGTNGATRSVSMGIDGPGARWMVRGVRCEHGHRRPGGRGGWCEG